MWAPLEDWTLSSHRPANSPPCPSAQALAGPHPLAAMRALPPPHWGLPLSRTWSAGGAMEG